MSFRIEETTCSVVLLSLAIGVKFSYGYYSISGYDWPSRPTISAISTLGIKSPSLV